MRKALKLFASTLFLTIGITFIAAAGEWKQDSVGWWYQNDDGSYPKNTLFKDPDSGLTHYFDSTGYMLYNCDTPEGYRIDVDGNVITDETTGAVFLVVAATGGNESPLALTEIHNESNEVIKLEPYCEIISNGTVKSMHMVDSDTLAPVDYGIIGANEAFRFLFWTNDYNYISINDETQVKFYFTIGGNTYGRQINLKTVYRVNLK